MARLITLGFDDPSEYLLGIPNAEIGSGVSASVRQVYYSGVLRSLQSFGALVLQGDNYWTCLLGGNYSALYFSGSFCAADSLTNGGQLVVFDTKTDGSFGSTLNVIWSTGGSLSIRRGTTVLATSTAGLVTAGVRYNIECYVKPRDSGGEFTVKLDGTQILTYSGDTTDNAATCDGFRLQTGTVTLNLTTWWDDVAVNDDSGSVNNSWIGRINLWPLYARGTGDVAQLSRGGLDLGANYAQVRDPDPTGQTFVQGDINYYDLYHVDTLDLPTGATINNIIVQVVGKSTSGAGYVAPMIKAADTESQGTDKLLSNGFLNVRQQAWATNPKTATAWTESDLSTLQIGVKIRS